MSDDDYLNAEVEAEDAAGPAAGAILMSIAEELESSPDGYRCDFKLEVKER